MININEADGLLHHPMLANNYNNFVIYNQNFHPYLADDKQNHMEQQEVVLSAKERKRRARQNQSPEARARRLAKDAARHREYYKTESDEKRSERRAKDAARHRESYSRRSSKKGDDLANGMYSEESRNSDQGVSSTGKRTASVALMDHTAIMQSSMVREAMLQQQQQQHSFVRGTNTMMSPSMSFPSSSGNQARVPSSDLTPAADLLAQNDLLLRNIGSSLAHLDTINSGMNGSIQNSMDYHRALQQQQQQLQQQQQQHVQHTYQMNASNNGSSTMQQQNGGGGGVVQAAIPLHPTSSN